MKKATLLLLYSALLLGLGSCTTTRPVSAALQTDAEYCVPPLVYSYDLATTPLPAIEPMLDSGLTARFSRRSLLVANAAGALPQLKALVRLERTARLQPSTTNMLAVLAERQRVQSRLQLLTVAVASVSAELDCEGERANQIANYLNAQANTRVQRLTVLSIAVGAVSGVGTTVSSNQAVQYIFGIGGGLLTAGLGLLTLSSHRTVSFTHPRNLLADVWQEAPASSVYPPGVWYMLTEKAFSNRGENSVAHNTRLRWQRYGQLAAPDTKAGREQQALLFGNGGLYEADELTQRANMLDELQSSVRLMSQELQGLLMSLDKDPARP
ncbi:hypothetical protein [Hymenobacter arizonensis]|uniref:Uncharacterized protein n=1 Tax=Hymenobacter arizonensis TaxID=1227077 RepID=A0A1I6AU82_HYMAR|nr:hypothetical protein [Hymenobacter arizonensis]SFQ72264.1 hypothetical protein SAMN04515668_3905 [Hymenobacter arizonensis]